MALRVYNTITGQKEPFTTVTPGKVGIYCCGPTVYMNSHIGHMVGPVIFDTIKRYLTYLGYKVTLVVNITDVEDKLINQATKENTTVTVLAERVTADYLANLRKPGADVVDPRPRAAAGDVVAAGLTVRVVVSWANARRLRAGRSSLRAARALSRPVRRSLQRHGPPLGTPRQGLQRLDSAPFRSGLPSEWMRRVHPQQGVDRRSQPKYCRW